jgi:hypothetical protein
MYVAWKGPHAGPGKVLRGRRATRYACQRRWIAFQPMAWYTAARPTSA